MNALLFKHLLEQLTDTDWQSVIDGKDLLIKDDSELLIGIPGSPNAIIVSSDYSFTDISNLKNQIFNKADEILSDYYRSNPLSKTGFNQQAEKLIKEFGFEAFCAPQGKVAKRTFFVEGGELVSETHESPRHRYGVFFESGQQVPAESLKGNFYKWLASGEAYSEYIGMNVCRYSC